MGIDAFDGVGSNVADFSFVTSEVSLSQLANSSCSAVYEGSGAQPLQVSKQWADFESTEKSRNSYLHWLMLISVVATSTARQRWPTDATGVYDVYCILYIIWNITYIYKII